MKDWNKTFMQVAELFAEHSTCARLHVGAVLVKDRRIISCGYNGTPSGMKHCEDVFKDVDLDNPEIRKNGVHHEFSLKYELHAEQNCLAYAAKTGVCIDDKCVLYTTTAPCTDCAKLIVAVGIKKVLFKDLYRRTSDGIRFLEEAGVEIKQIDK